MWVRPRAPQVAVARSGPEQPRKLQVLQTAEEVCQLFPAVALDNHTYWAGGYIWALDSRRLDILE